MQDGQKKSIYKNVFYKTILNLFNLVVPLVVGSYALRVLGDASSGIVDYSTAIYEYFFIFAQFGIYYYGLREISRIRDDKKKVQELFGSLFVLGLISNITVVICFLLFIFTKFQGNPMMPVLMALSLNFLSNIFYIEWINEAVENYSFITIKSIIVRLIYLVLLFTFVKDNGDFLNYALVTITWLFLNNISSYIYIRKRVGISFKNIRLAKHIKPLIMVVILTNANVLFTKLDILMIGDYLGNAQVAYYTIGQKVVSIINAIVLSIITVSIPRLSNHIANGDKKAYKSLLDNITNTFCAFLFPASIGIFCLSKEIILLYGGPEFAPAQGVLAVFAIYMISLGFEYIVTQQVMYVNKKEKVTALFIFSCGVINLILNVSLLKLGIFTPTTAIFTTMIANYLMVISIYVYIRKGLKLDFNLFAFNKMKYLVVSLIFIPVSMSIKYFTSNMILVVLLVGGINSIIYVAILYVVKDKILFSIIDMVKKKLKKK
ncbi:MAG: oligosaccharide flippase family protein [Clostridium sp.]